MDGYGLVILRTKLQLQAMPRSCLKVLVGVESKFSVQLWVKLNNSDKGR